MSDYTIYTVMWPRSLGWWYEDHASKIYLLHCMPAGAYVFRFNTFTDDDLARFSDEA